MNRYSSLIYSKKHSNKVKSKFSRWTNFPPNKLCLGEICPHHFLGNLRLLLPIMKEWDLLTVERDGEMLISSERGWGEWWKNFVNFVGPVRPLEIKHFGWVHTICTELTQIPHLCWKKLIFSFSENTKQLLVWDVFLSLFLSFSVFSLCLEEVSLKCRMKFKKTWSKLPESYSMWKRIFYYIFMRSHR